MYPRLASTLIAKDDLEFFIFFPPATSRVLGIEPKVPYMLGKHSTN